MTEPSIPGSRPANRPRRLFAPGWGQKLFLGALVAILAFFWWLLIWSGGVNPHHG